MDNSDLWKIILIVSMMIFSAVFSGTETAYSSVNKLRLKNYEAQGSKKAAKALKLANKFDEVLTAVLIGNNIVNIAASSVSTLLFISMYGDNGAAVSTIVITLLVLTFCEVIPKSYAKKNAEKIALAFATPLTFLVGLFKPLVFLLNKLSALFDRGEDVPSVTEDELKYMIDEIEEQGVIEEQESELVKSALEFDEITVNEILIPRVKVIGVEVNSSIDEIKELFSSEMYSRLPVYEKSLDDIVGIITNKSFFKMLVEGKSDIRDIIQEVPHIADSKLISEAMKDEKGVGLLYNDSVFGNRLWKPITSQLQGVKKIYFSPTGMFYQMGIEYLPCDANQRINDLYAVYRLSSTKSLIHPTKVEKISTATIYGGLNYDMSLTALRSQHDKCLDNESHAPLLAYTDTRSPGYVYGMQRTLDSLSIRGSVNFLEGTKYEALNINEQLLQNNVDTTYVLMGDEGIEETFKQLNGTSRSIIHIATHGFSFSEQEIKEKGDKLVFINEQNDNLDNMLNYSGLLMSGSNYVLKGRKLPEDIEDGILTAREISQVDLGKVGLVVLSACQTALGEIREDGVFGIQRGFKKAGAHSLLMSLWKVDDRATEIMMTAFYRNLVKSNDRYDAFKKAQKTVRERGFKSPYYWASFILLDGK